MLEEALLVSFIVDTGDAAAMLPEELFEFSLISFGIRFWFWTAVSDIAEGVLLGVVGIGEHVALAFLGDFEP